MPKTDEKRLNTKAKDMAGLSPEEREEAERAEETRKRADSIARQIINMTRNGLFVTLRFMDVALCQFDYINADRLADPELKVGTIATTGQHMIYSPRYVIEQYMKDKQVLSRDYLHMVLHCVFRHPFVSRSLKPEIWDLACDIAVESIISELDVKQSATRNEEEINAEVKRIKDMLKLQPTAERLYAWILSGAPQQRDLDKWRRLFHHDQHRVWWEIAKQIEEEMKRRAEEEEDTQEDGYEEEAQSGQEEENDEEDSGEDSQDGDEDAEGGDQGADQDGEEGQEGSEESDEGDSEESEGDVGSDEDEEDSGEESGEDQSEESEDSEVKDGSEEDKDDDEDQWREDTYEEEFTSSPGESNQNPDEDSQPDPDSDTQEAGDDDGDSGSGGGGAGDDSEKSEEEGSDRGDEAADGSQADSGKDQSQNSKDDRKRPDSNMKGSTDEGQRDDSDDFNPFGDDNTGNTADMTGAGGTKNQPGSQSGEHSAGSGGGGEGAQAAWEHSSGESSRGAEDQEGSRSRMDGSSDTEGRAGDRENQKEEARAEQGTADSEEEPEEAPSYAHSGEEQKELEDRWKEISERMLVDLETASREWGDRSDAMVQGIKKVNRDKYDYATFLEKFSTLREDIQINDDEFDYVYYTLGMERYGNIPLIEPLEYKEVRKVRDFVIAIDTSGSCAGEVVQKFLDKTFSIFSQQENFFRKINLHIIQCDAEIQEAVKITDKTEFEDYIRNLEFKGFGGTDFRPVFAYVDHMLEEGEFDDLKGLIYFTDGNGTYPKRRPAYETAFIFVDDDEFEYQVPGWAMKLVLETGDIMEEVNI